MTIALRAYTVTVAAGSERVLDAAGNYVRCYSSSLTDFNIGVDDGGFLPMSQGLAFEFEDEFRRLRIANPNGNAITVILYVGRGRVLDDRSISDAPQKVTPETLAEFQEQIFTAELNVATGATEFAMCEFRNPADSDKVLLLRRLTLYTNIASSIAMDFGGIGGATTELTATTIARVSDGSTVTAAERYAITSATSPGVGIPQRQPIYFDATTGASATPFFPGLPLPLNPNRSIYGRSGTMNADLTMYVEYQEVLA